MTELKEEVQQVLSNQDEIRFEEITEEDSSPLNLPVKEKVISSPLGVEQNTTSQNIDEQGYEHTPTLENETDDTSNFEESVEDRDDVPEQQISEYDQHQTTSDEEEFEVPIGHAKQAADTFLGMADNLLEVGGGFFVKIKKHRDFYDFEELIQVIEEQNQKNVKRIKLDEEDKALLHPLLVTILRKRAKKLTPEQQLMGALISIMVKKAQVVMEVRTENEMLVDRMLEIIREERGYAPAPPNDNEQDDQQQEQEVEQEQETGSSHSNDEQFPSETVMEVAEESDTDNSEKS